MIWYATAVHNYLDRYSRRMGIESECVGTCTVGFADKKTRTPIDYTK